jgi:hypothetical protein
MAQPFEGALPWPTDASKSRVRKTEQAGETTPGGQAETPWLTVAVNLSPAEAAVIKSRLESERIPAIVQQESAGVVFGLTVGPMGFARLLVPEPLAELARSILADTLEPLEDVADDLAGD